MSLKHLCRIRKTLAFRLAVSYAVIYTISSFLAFLIFYLIVSFHLNKKVDEELLAESKEFNSFFFEEGLEKTTREVIRDAEADGIEKFFFRLLTIDGKILQTSDMSEWPDIGIGNHGLDMLSQGRHHFFQTKALPGFDHNIRMVYAKMGPDHVLQIGLELQDKETFLHILRKIFTFTLLCIFFMAAIIGWFMAKKSLSGVEEVTRTALAISQDGILEKRVVVKNQGAEIEQLSTMFNSMLDRIQKLLAGTREITDNISHDLRTPISRIRSALEITLTGGLTFDEFKDLAGDAIEDCDRLLEMIKTMLYLSSIELSADNIEMKTVELASIIRDACDLFNPLAEDKNITLTFDILDSPKIKGHLQGLQRMVANLLDNAIKYNSDGGYVYVSLKKEDEMAKIAFEDTGMGISPSDLPHIFNRFFRCDKSRSDNGIGLGLSLAQAIAQNHGGDITVKILPDGGSIFVISLPLISVTENRS